MKPLAVWLAGVAIVFGGFAAFTVANREVETVFVVVDSSFPMQEVWADVPDELAAIERRDHTEFALATEKEPIHSYQSEFDFSGVAAFAPCTFDEIEDHPDAADADERILITTADSCPTDGLDDWTVIELAP